MPIFKQNKTEKISRNIEQFPDTPLGSEETRPSPEKGEGAIVDRNADSVESRVSRSETGQPSLAPQPVSDSDVAIKSIPKSITLQKIEGILEEGLSDIYFHLDTAHQRLFKEEGERASRQIEAVLATGKSVAAKVLAIIKKWLQTIPGINKFFIEQEAKIKTDKITRINAGLP